MGILRSAQNQILPIQHVNEARVAFNQRNSTRHYLRKNFVKWIGGSHPAANVVEEVYFGAGMYILSSVHV